MFSKLQTATAIALCLAGSAAWTADALHDPTRPYATESRAALKTPAFSVSAILISDGRRVAVLNGKAVKSGDQIDGATVNAIHADGVQLKFEGRLIEAALPKGKIRQ